MTESRRLVNRLVAGSNVLRDAGVNMYEYTEQLTFLLFLKMAEERATRSLNREPVVPDEYSWHQLLGLSGEELEDAYNHILRGLANQPGCSA
jgi:type I restriction enzyme M protein